MTLLLDSDILIDVQRSHAPALAWLSNLTDIPSVLGYVVMELIQDAENARKLKQTLQLLAPLPVVWPTQDDCNRALTDFKRFRLSHKLGLLDVLIGECAVGMGATLCTFNLKHYRVIPGLLTQQPYGR